MRKPIVIAYDIVDSKTRRQVYRIVRAWRLDGQKSVHECRLTTSEAEELFLQISTAMDPDRDKLMMAWIDGHCPVLYGGGAGSVTSGNILHLS